MTKAEEAAANAATGQSMDGRISGSRAPFAVQSIAGEAGKARRGAAMDRRACEAVHGRTVRATPPRREARGILRRGMRCKTPRSVPSLLPTFWHCQKWVARRRRVEAFLPPLPPFGHPLPQGGRGPARFLLAARRVKSGAPRRWLAGCERNTACAGIRSTPLPALRATRSHRG